MRHTWNEQKKEGGKATSLEHKSHSFFAGSVTELGYVKCLSVCVQGKRER